MRKLHKERLLRLADKLEGKGPYEDVGPVPTRKFELWDYFSSEKGRWRRAIEQGEFNPNQCKTAACACGWASVDPWFRRQRFGYSPYTSPDRTIPSDKFFGLAWPDWKRLFLREHYSMTRNPTPRDVARRIRKLVAESET